jgi:HPt (histidine-containing phosphotransfer) domain-containing protein
VFVRETRKDMDILAAALGNGDFHQVVRLAHRIKGASASIRAGFLSEEAARLQIFGAERSGAEAGRCFARLQAEFQQFQQFIEAMPPLSD